MKIKAQTIQYSSVVGGGIMLLDEAGRARGQIAFIGGAVRITKEQDAALSKGIADLINAHGLEIPE
jgi:hypothetical protein